MEKAYHPNAQSEEDHLQDSWEDFLESADRDNDDAEDTNASDVLGEDNNSTSIASLGNVETSLEGDGGSH